MIPKLKPGFDNHRFIGEFYDPATDLSAIIALHRGSISVPSFGATRITTYRNYNEALKDALKLSKLMSYKAAMAGVKYGGAKGVLVLPRKVRNRNLMLKNYSNFVNYLNGHFITGADVGVSNEDVRQMKANSKFIVGATSNPVKYTAVGVLSAIEVCLEKVYGSSSLKARSFAIQGVGKIGTGLLALLHAKAGKIYISDIDRARLKQIKQKYKKVEIVHPDEIFRQKVDVFSPCALGSSINIKSINKLRCAIVAGGANSQLENEESGELLHTLGILYAPDYVANAGGLISVVDEYEHSGKFLESRILKRLNNIRVTLKKIFAQSQRENEATNIIANQMAEKIFNSH